MSIAYQVLSKRNPNNLGAPPRFYGSALVRRLLNFDDLCEELTSRCTATRADIKLVLTALVDQMPVLLLEGYVIQLGELGNFRLTLRSEGVVAEELFSYRNIKGVRLVYTPGMKLKQRLKKARFERIKSKKAKNKRKEA